MENSERDGNIRPPDLPPEKSVCRSRSSGTGHGITDRLQLGKEYVKAVYSHLTYLTYMQSKSCEMLDWMKHKLESRLPAEISITSDMQMTPPLAESEEELKNLMMKMKEESENACLKLSIQNTKIMASGPITSWQIDGETMETVTDFIVLSSKSHCRW